MIDFKKIFGMIFSNIAHLPTLESVVPVLKSVFPLTFYPPEILAPRLIKVEN